MPVLFAIRLRVFLCLLAVLFFGGATSASAEKKDLHGSKRDIRHTVEALEEQWRIAQLGSDTATMDRLLAEDFVGISISGQANTKAEYLDRIRNRVLVLKRIDLAERKIKLLGNVAIVTSMARVEGTNGGESMRGTFRYTRVYQRLASGAWKTTNFEATRVPTDRGPN